MDQEKQEIKKPIVTGATKKKRSRLSSRIKEEFFQEATGNLGEYLLFDVAIPAARNLIYDITIGSIERALGVKRNNYNQYNPWSQYGSYNRPTTISTPHTAYGNRFNQPATQPVVDERSRVRPSGIEEIEFNSIYDAESILAHLQELIDLYGFCKLADLHEMLGWTVTPSDYKFGWDRLNTKPNRGRGGKYVVCFPPLIEL